jgi:N-acetylmuramoyl-L-alanine amidase
MKSRHLNSILFTAGVLASATAASASTDYGPAIWRQAYSGHWYTSGNGHHFAVCHDMEGYYAATISYFQQSSTQASIHYCVNGLKDNSSDYPAGEITQMVREAYYSWHARCWNTWMFGTEHEGFVSNPAWYTDAMYNASGLLQRHLCDVYGIPKDRHHIIGHNEWQNSSWVTWMGANYPSIDPTCNTHTDPGQYWDWGKLMGIITGTSTTIIVDNVNSGFSASANWTTGTSSTDKYGIDYRWNYVGTVADVATFSTSLPSSGTWTVYVWYPQGSNRSTVTPYIISTSSGTTTKTVNQQINGGQWVSLGAFSMNSGANTVKVSCQAASGTVVIADAVKWVK